MGSPYRFIRLGRLISMPKSSDTLIFSATHDIHGEVVAKIYRLEYFSDLGLKIRELVLQARMRHPSVVQALDIDVVKNDQTIEVVLIVEKLSRDLEVEINERAAASLPYTELELLDFLRKMTDVLCEAQQLVLSPQRICHRDLKPSNIFIKGSDYKIGDFGEAKVMKEMPDTLRSSVRGTPEYMAPLLQEALRSHRNTALHNPFRSDVYSLGMTVLSMACLQNFHSNTDVQKLLSSLRYSSEFTQLLSRMLQQDEASRPDFLQLQGLLKPNSSLEELLQKVVEEARRAQRATAVLATHLETLWGECLLKKWNLPKAENARSPQFYIRKLELFEHLSGVPCHSQKAKISGYHFNYIPITEFVTEPIPLPATHMQVDIEDAGSRETSVMKEYGSLHFAGSGVMIRKDYSTVVLTEMPTGSPALIVKLPPGKPRSIVQGEMYRIVDVMLVITSVSEAYLELECRGLAGCTAVRLSAGSVAKVGREESSAVVLPYNGVSKKHSAFHCRAGVWTIEDLNSTNGTWLLCHCAQSLERESNEIRVREGDEVRWWGKVCRFSLAA